MKQIAVVLFVCALAASAHAYPNDDAWFLQAPAVSEWTPIPDMAAHWLLNDDATNLPGIVSDHFSTNTGTVFPATLSTATMSTNGVAVSHGGLFFNGVSNNQYADFAQMGFNLHTGAWTFCIWVWPLPCANAQSASGMILSKDSSSSRGPQFSFYNPYKPCYSYGAGAQIFTPDSVLTTQWSHVAFRFDGANISIAINGVVATNTAATVPSASTATWKMGIRIWPLNNYAFNGSMDDGRIYFRAISDAELSQIVNSGIGTEQE